MDADYLSNLDAMERACAKTLSEVLSPLLNVSSSLLSHAPKIIQFTKRPAVYVPSLVQHMLLKQAMISLRTICLLLVRGYSAPAATIGCSLYEMALYSCHISNDAAKADQFLHHPNSQTFVWQPKEMMKYSAEQTLQARGKSGDQVELQQEIELLNLPYIYLCSIKHSNPITLRHTVAARVEEPDLAGGMTPFAVLPDTRPEDHKVKAFVLGMANHSTFQITSRAVSTAVAVSKERLEWFTELTAMEAQNANVLVEMGKRFGPMPFPIVRK